MVGRGHPRRQIGYDRPALAAMARTSPATRRGGRIACGQYHRGTVAREASASSGRGRAEPENDGNSLWHRCIAPAITCALRRSSSQSCNSRACWATRDAAVGEDLVDPSHRLPTNGDRPSYS